MNTKELEFVKTVWGYYGQHGRTMPWREPEPDGCFDPYKILVSEMMLQQTQVERVAPKFKAFIKQFPNLEVLAQATLYEVIELWSGLGYNRRAKYLHDAAKELSRKPFPQAVEELTKYKGIGPNTAAAVLVYSYNKPLIFVETNIRTVYTYHFFNQQTAIKEIAYCKKLAITIDADNAREWYWALMDYGTYLKKNGVRNNAQSEQHIKQNKFEGSMRQIRGEVIRQAQKNVFVSDLIKVIPDERLIKALEALQKDGLVKVNNGRLSIA
jgi:A/G-specific adenine glycosylase